MDSTSLINFVKNNYVLIVIIVLFIIVMLYLSFTKQNKNNADSNKENFVMQPDKKRKYKLTLYYTNWCGYSRQFLPEWDKFKDYVDNLNLNDTIIIEKIDCDSNKDMCKAISGYPTVILEKDDGSQIIMKSHPRTKEGIIKFIEDNNY